MDKEMELSAGSVQLEQGLRDIYYNPKTGYQSSERLYKKALEDGLNVNRKLVKEWLKSQDTYTRYKPVVRKHKFRKTFVNFLGDQIHMDLEDMGSYKNQNKGYYWILTAVEILSRYAFAVPVYRKDTNNMTKAITELLKQFKDRFDERYPKVAQFDDGKEFYNVGVKTLLEKHEIEYFSMKLDKKAAIVERFNRALKSMWKYFYSKGTYKWIDILNQLVYNYNNTKKL